MKIDSAQFIKGIRGTDPINNDGVPHIAFFGRSNVGKSSTINMLLERKNLVKSSSKPGKTKEINFFLVNEQYYFVDLPGYGYAKMSQKAREKLRKMILWYLVDVAPAERTLVLVLDAKVGVSEFDAEIINIARETEQSLILYVNKTDKLKQKEVQALKKTMEAAFEYPTVFASASKKRGRDNFFEAVFV